MFKGRDDWFEIWYDDKGSVLDTMVRNMVSDLDNGYSYFGASITRQREDIEAYKTVLEAQIDAFVDMDEKTVNRWCYYDMVKRGVIEP